MFIIRPIKANDIDALEQLASSAALGMSSLPKSRHLLKVKIDHSLESFSKNVSKPQNELYCFVLENNDTGEVGGSCAIYAKTGTDQPIYYYQIETSYPSTHTLPVSEKLTVLKPMKLSNGPSELSMLFLQKSWRKKKLGELLSLSRLLFIAEHPQRFDSKISARLRGMQSKNGNSPFWSGLGNRFVNISFKKACELQQEEYPYLEEFLPKYPIYTQFLSKRAFDAIGKPLRSTEPALQMLCKEGFSITADIDLFDAGPILQGETSELRSIRKSRRFTLSKPVKFSTRPPVFFVSNTKLDFRCCFSEVELANSHTLNLPENTARSLQALSGDSVRIAPLHTTVQTSCN